MGEAVHYVAVGVRVFWVLSLVMWPTFWFDFYDRKPKLGALTRWWMGTGMPDILFMIGRTVVAGFILFALTAIFMQS